jgi:hypothetical protein
MENLNIKELALAVYNKQVPSNFSITDMEGTLREQFRALAPDFNSYRRNKLAIFEIIQEVVDAVLPNRVRENIGVFAEVKTMAQGNKARFKVKKGKNNVKRFITKVALGGVFERVRLDSDFVDVQTYAMGGAGYVELEQFLDGTMDFAELTDLIMGYMEDEIFKAIHVALIGTFASLPAANKYTGAGFSSADLKRIIATVKAYGGNANIICTPEWAATITPDANFVGDADKADVRDQGYIGRFAGANVIVLPQSFEDETNTTKVFDPRHAFIIPTGGSADEKIVKVALEGQTIVKDIENADMSMEFQAYKKFGTAVLNVNHFGMITNTSVV